MILTLPRRPALFFLSAIVLLVGVESLIIRSAAFSRAPTLFSVAVLFDLTVVSSVLYYGLLARQAGGAAIRTGVVALLMVRVSLLLLPPSTLPPYLNEGLLLAMAELGALTIATIRVGTIWSTYLRLRPTTTADIALQGALASVFGERAAGFIQNEWQIVRYVIGGWRLRSDVPMNATALTTHRDSGQIALTVALGMVCLVELATMHLLVTHWSPNVAFWLTIASGYSLLMLFADIVATLKRPSYQTADTLYVRLGIRWQAVISRGQIHRIEPIYEKPTRQNGLLNAALLTEPNVLLTLSKPVMVQGPYGIRREVTQLALWIDGGTAALA